MVKWYLAQEYSIKTRVQLDVKWFKFQVKEPSFTLKSKPIITRRGERSSPQTHQELGKHFTAQRQRVLLQPRKRVQHRWADHTESLGLHRLWPVKPLCNILLYVCDVPRWCQRYTDCLPDINSDVSTAKVKSVPTVHWREINLFWFFILFYY